MIKINFAIVLLLVCFNTLADNSIDREIVNKLARDLKPFIKKFKRDTPTYNWRGLESLNNTAEFESDKISSKEAIDIHDTRILTYVKRWHKSWKVHANTTAPLGWGHYAGNTPNWSSYFGDENWLMTEVIIPAGKKYLDLRNVFGFYLPISYEVIEMIRQQNLCDIPDGLKSINYHGRNYRTITKQNFMKSARCANFFVKVIEKLNISTVVYLFNNSQAWGCSNEKTKIAFVLWDFDFNQNRVKGYVKTLEKNPTYKKLVEYSRMQGLAASLKEKSKLNWGIPTFNEDADDLGKLFGCGNIKKKKFILEKTRLDFTEKNVALRYQLSFPDYTNYSKENRQEIFFEILESIYLVVSKAFEKINQSTCSELEIKSFKKRLLKKVKLDNVIVKNANVATFDINVKSICSGETIFMRYVSGISAVLKR